MSLGSDARRYQNMHKRLYKEGRLEENSSEGISKVLGPLSMSATSSRESSGSAFETSMIIRSANSESKIFWTAKNVLQLILAFPQRIVISLTELTLGIARHVGSIESSID